jgi:hypothetical protein
MIPAKDELKHVAETLTEEEAERVLDALHTHATWLFVEANEEDD